MKTSDVDILIVPGWSSSGPDHWQSRWQRHFDTAHRIEQDDWVTPKRKDWTNRILQSAERANRKIVLVGHSIGVIAVAHAASQLPEEKTLGAYLVAPADVENADKWPVTEGFKFTDTKSDFAPIPQQALPFPAMVIASSSDPYCELSRAQTLASQWNASFVEAGALGHINVDSGHGPWPEGLLGFAKFLKTL